MITHLVRRLVSAVPTLFIIVTVAFFMMRAAPGGPFDRERPMPPEILENVLRAYDMDKPVHEQYLDYVWKLMHGDFGPSLSFRDFTVTDLILGGFPASLQIGSLALLAAVLIGVALGSVAALRQNSRLDYGSMAFAMTGIAIPNFVMAPILTLVFGVHLSWLPVAGWGDGSMVNKVLPITALALPQIAYIARLTRGSMVEVLHSNFVRTARAKGLTERIVIVRHALKGAMLPVVSYLGPAAAAVVTGSVVIESIFDIPGLGRYFVQGALNRDYTLVMGTVVFYAGLIITFNLIVDMLYALLDPKVRLE